MTFVSEEWKVPQILLLFDGDHSKGVSSNSSLPAIATVLCRLKNWTLKWFQFQGTDAMQSSQSLLLFLF